MTICKVSYKSVKLSIVIKMSKKKWNTSSLWTFHFYSFYLKNSKYGRAIFQNYQGCCGIIDISFSFCGRLSETGKIYLFSLKGEMCLVIIFYFLFIYIKGQVTITGNLEKWGNWVIRHIYCHKIKEMLLR